MNQRANDTPEQVIKFVPREKTQNKVPQVDEAGEAIVARAKFGWRRNGIDRRAPRCAIHQFPVAPLDGAED